MQTADLQPASIHAQSRGMDKIYTYATVLPFCHMVWQNFNPFF